MRGKIVLVLFMTISSSYSSFRIRLPSRIIRASSAINVPYILTNRRIAPKIESKTPWDSKIISQQGRKLAMKLYTSNLKSSTSK